MKYYFHADTKQRAKGFPFEVEFDSDDCCGIVLISKNAYYEITWCGTGMPNDTCCDDVEIKDKAEFFNQLDMYLTGEAFLD